MKRQENANILTICTGIASASDFLSQSKDFVLNGTLYSIQVISYSDGGDAIVAGIDITSVVLVLTRVRDSI